MYQTGLTSPTRGGEQETAYIRSHLFSPSREEVGAVPMSPVSPYTPSPPSPGNQQHLFQTSISTRTAYLNQNQSQQQIPSFYSSRLGPASQIQQQQPITSTPQRGPPIESLYDRMLAPSSSLQQQQQQHQISQQNQSINLPPHPYVQQTPNAASIFQLRSSNTPFSPAQQQQVSIRPQIIQQQNYVQSQLGQQQQQQEVFTPAPPPVDENRLWVTLFGFPQERMEETIQFICQCQIPSLNIFRGPNGSNWVCIKFETIEQAQNIASRATGAMLPGSNSFIGAFIGKPDQMFSSPQISQTRPQQAQQQQQMFSSSNSFIRNEEPLRPMQPQQPQTLRPANSWWNFFYQIIGW